MYHPEEKVTAAIRILKESLLANVTNHTTATTSAATNATVTNSGEGVHSIDKEQLVLFSLMFVVMSCVVVLCTRPDKKQQGTTREAVTTTGTTGTTASNEPRRELSLPKIIIRMTKKDRFQYYSSLFEMNNNQIKLTPDQIIKGNSENSNNKKEEQKNETNLEISAASQDDEEEDEEEPSIYLSLDIV